jgi:iron(III) transport system permease protein
MTVILLTVRKEASLRQRFRFQAFPVVATAITVLVAALAVYPVIRVVLGLFMQNGEFTADPLTRAFDVDGLGKLIFNTVVVVVASSAIALVLGSLLAWLNERTDARMGTLTDSLPLIPFLLPPIAGAIGWVLLLSPTAGLLNAVIKGVIGWFTADPPEVALNIFTWYGLIFVYVLYQVPYAFMMVSAALRNLDTSLDEQSRVCGAGTQRTLSQVTLPAIKQALGGAVLLMMVQGFALFSVPIIIGTGARIDVLAVRIVELLSFSFPPETAQAIGLSLIMVLFVAASWVFQARILRRGRFAAIAGKGQRSKLISLGKWRPFARTLMLGYGLVAVVLPVSALVLVTLNGYWTPDIGWSSLTISHFMDAVVRDSGALTALTNSVRLGIEGATIGMGVAAIVSLYMLRNKKRYIRFLDGAIKLPGVVSHMVIAVGFILAFAGPPFALAGTTTILLLAYIAIYLPQGSVSADSAASQVAPELGEASAVAGAGRGRTFGRIHIPLMMPGLIAGWAYLFARMAGDLTATAILGGPNNLVIGYLILQVFQNGSYGQLAPIAVALTVISTVIVVAALALARLQGRWRRTSSAKVAGASAPGLVSAQPAT